jgi:hypothetical protein
MPSSSTVNPMTLDQLRTVIQRPADAAGLRLDEGLADVMLHELGATRPAGSEGSVLPQRGGITDIHA